MSVTQDFRAVETVFPRIPETFSDNFIIGGKPLFVNRRQWSFLLPSLFPEAPAADADAGEYTPRPPPAGCRH